MKRKRFTDEQIAMALRQTEGGTPVADVCRQIGVSEASFYLWKKKYAKLGLTEIRELRQLRDENGHSVAIRLRVNARMASSVPGAACHASLVAHASSCSDHICR